MRRRWPCESTRAGSERWRASATLSSASRQWLRARSPIAFERHQRGEILLRGELVLERRAGVRRTRPPPAARGRTGRTRWPCQRISPASGADRPASMRKQRGLAGAVGARDDQRLARADAERKPGEKPRKPTARGEFLRFQHESSVGPGRGTGAATDGRKRAAPAAKIRAIIADAPSRSLRGVNVPAGLLSWRSPIPPGSTPMPDKEIRAASLEYHRQLPPGKISVPPTKNLTNQRDLALAYTPGVAAACDEIVRDPARGAQPDGARQPGRRRHQRHRGAGPGRDRPARREAGDGRQGGALQEVRRHRLFRHRDRRARSGQAGRDHRRARADVRRHQSRGHQGAGVLLRRAQAAASA